VHLRGTGQFSYMTLPVGADFKTRTNLHIMSSFADRLEFRFITVQKHSPMMARWRA
jgi:hypothetical protein